MKLGSALMHDQSLLALYTMFEGCEASDEPVADGMSDNQRCIIQHDLQIVGGFSGGQ